MGHRTPTCPKEVEGCVDNGTHSLLLWPRKSPQGSPPFPTFLAGSLSLFVVQKQQFSPRVSPRSNCCLGRGGFSTAFSTGPSCTSRLYFPFPIFKNLYSICLFCFLSNLLYSYAFGPFFYCFSCFKQTYFLYSIRSFLCLKFLGFNPASCSCCMVSCSVF